MPPPLSWVTRKAWSVPAQHLKQYILPQAIPRRASLQRASLKSRPLEGRLPWGRHPVAKFRGRVTRRVQHRKTGHLKTVLPSHRGHRPGRLLVIPKAGLQLGSHRVGRETPVPFDRPISGLTIKARGSRIQPIRRTLARGVR